MKNIKRILALVLAVVMTVGGLASVSAASVNMWYDEAVACLELNGIATIGDNRDKEVSREEFVTWVAKIETYRLGDAVWNDDSAVVSFTDVTAENRRAAIAYSYQMGYIIGNGDGTFAPEKTLTYAEACAVIVRLLGFEGKVANMTEWESQYWRVANIYCHAFDSVFAAKVPWSTSGSERKLCYGEAAYLLATLINWAGYAPSNVETTVLTEDGRNLGDRFANDAKNAETVMMLVSYLPMKTADAAVNNVSKLWRYTGDIADSGLVVLDYLDSTLAASRTSVTVKGSDAKKLVAQSLSLTGDYAIRDYFDKGSIVKATLSDNGAGVKTVTRIQVLESVLVDTYLVNPAYNAAYAGWTYNTATGASGSNPVLSARYTSDLAVEWVNVTSSSAKLQFKGVTYTVTRSAFVNSASYGDQIHVYNSNTVKAYVANTTARLTAAPAAALTVYPIAYAKGSTIAAGTILSVEQYKKLSAADRAKCSDTLTTYMRPAGFGDITLSVKPTTNFHLAGWGGTGATAATATNPTHKHWMSAAGKVIPADTAITGVQLGFLSAEDQEKLAYDVVNNVYVNTYNPVKLTTQPTAVLTVGGTTYNNGDTLPVGSVLTPAQYASLCHNDKVAMALHTSKQYRILTADAVVATGTLTVKTGYGMLESQFATYYINGMETVTLTVASSLGAAGTKIGYETRITAAQYDSLCTADKEHFAPYKYYAARVNTKTYNVGDSVPAGTLVPWDSNATYTLGTSTRAAVLVEVQSTITLSADTTVQRAAVYAKGGTNVPVGTLLDGTQYAALTDAAKACVVPVTYWRTIVNTSGQARRAQEIIPVSLYEALSDTNKNNYIPYTFVVVKPIDVSTAAPCDAIVVYAGMTVSNGIGNYRTNAQQGGIAYTNLYEDYNYSNIPAASGYGLVKNFIPAGTKISAEQYNALAAADRAQFTAVDSYLDYDGSYVSGFNSKLLTALEAKDLIINPAQGEMAVRFNDTDGDGKYEELYILSSNPYEFSETIGYSIQGLNSYYPVAYYGNDEANPVTIVNTFGEKVCENAYLKRNKVGGILLDNNWQAEGGTDGWKANPNAGATNKLQLVIIPSNERWATAPGWSQGYGLTTSATATTASNSATIADLTTAYIKSVETAKSVNGVVCYPVVLQLNDEAKTLVNYYLPAMPQAETTVTYTFNGASNTMTFNSEMWLLFVYGHNKTNSIGGVSVGENTGASMAGHQIKFAADENKMIYVAVECVNTSLTGFVSNVVSTDSGDNTYKVTLVSDTGARGTYEVRAAGTSIFDYTDYVQYQRLYQGRYANINVANGEVDGTDLVRATAFNDGNPYYVLSNIQDQTRALAQVIAENVLYANDTTPAAHVATTDAMGVVNGYTSTYDILVAYQPYYERVGQNYTKNYHVVEEYAGVVGTAKYKITGTQKVVVDTLHALYDTNGNFIADPTGVVRDQLNKANPGKYAVDALGFLCVVEPLEVTVNVYDATKIDSVDYAYAALTAVNTYADVCFDDYVAKDSLVVAVNTIVDAATYAAYTDTQKASFVKVATLGNPNTAYAQKAYVKGEAGYIPGSYHVYIDGVVSNLYNNTSAVVIITPKNGNGDFTITTTNIAALEGVSLFVTRVDLLANALVILGEAPVSSTGPSEDSKYKTVYLTSSSSMVEQDSTGNYWVVKSTTSAYELPSGDEVGSIYMKYPTYKEAQAAYVANAIAKNTWYTIDDTGMIQDILGTSDVYLKQGEITSVGSGKNTIATLNGKAGIDVTGYNFEFFYTDVDGNKLYKAGDSTNVTLMPWAQVLATFADAQKIADDTTKSAAERAEAAAQVEQLKADAITKYLNGQFWCVDNSPAFLYIQIEKVSFQNPNASVTFNYMVAKDANGNDVYCVMVDTFCK